MKPTLRDISVINKNSFYCILRSNKLLLLSIFRLGGDVVNWTHILCNSFLFQQYGHICATSCILFSFLQLRTYIRLMNISCVYVWIYVCWKIPTFLTIICCLGNYDALLRLYFWQDMIEQYLCYCNQRSDIDTHSLWKKPWESRYWLFLIRPFGCCNRCNFWHHILRRATLTKLLNVSLQLKGHATACLRQNKSSWQQQELRMLTVLGILGLKLFQDN